MTNEVIDHLDETTTAHNQDDVGTTGLDITDLDILYELNAKIVQWGRDRNLIVGATPKDQFIKLMEEIKELESKPFDSVGDTFVVMSIISAQLNIDPSEWLYLSEDPSHPDQIGFVHDDPEVYAGVIARLAAGLAQPLVKSRHSEIPAVLHEMFTMLNNPAFFPFAVEGGDTIESDELYSEAIIDFLRGGETSNQAMHGVFVDELFMGGDLVVVSDDTNADDQVPATIPIYVIDLIAAVNHAWEEIKDRKGMMVGGMFVKENDLTPELIERATRELAKS